MSMSFTVLAHLHTTKLWMNKGGQGQGADTNIKGVNSKTQCTTRV